MQTQADPLTQQGETYKAHPLLCQLALYTMATSGADSAQSVRAVYRVVRSTYLQGRGDGAVMQWLLPRVVQHFGIDSPDTRWVVTYAAIGAYSTPDARENPQATQLTAQLAQQLPGGLGWGSTVIAPVPDEESYNRHVVLQYQGYKTACQGQYGLAKDMLTRCVAYFDSVGPHWLATPRKYRCKQLIGMCISETEGHASAEAYYREAKRGARQELGPTHELTIDFMWAHADALTGLKRHEQALSELQKTLRLRQEVYGRHHVCLITNQITIAGQLLYLGRGDQSIEAGEAAFTQAIRAQGARGDLTTHTLHSYWNIVQKYKGREEAEALRVRAAGLGCDIETACNHDYTERIMAQMARRN